MGHGRGGGGGLRTRWCHALQHLERPYALYRAALARAACLMPGAVPYSSAPHAGRSASYRRLRERLWESLASQEPARLAGQGLRSGGLGWEG